MSSSSIQGLVASTSNLDSQQSGDELASGSGDAAGGGLPWRQQRGLEVVIAAKRFFAALKASEESLILGHQITARLEQFAEHEPPAHAASIKLLRKLLRGSPEIVITGDEAYVVLRPRMGIKEIVRLHPAASTFEPVSREEYLQLKDGLVQGREVASRPGLVIDFAPFFRGLPRVSATSEMGSGLLTLNRHLSAQMYQNPERFRAALLDFLITMRLEGADILVNDHMQSVAVLTKELRELLSDFEDFDLQTPYRDVSHLMRSHGFEAGWGATVGKITETLKLVDQVLTSADHNRFAELLGRLPLVHSVLMVSPHGWFAQEGVLGRPDTGGQVTYVLDQARALELEINTQLANSGLEQPQARVIVLTRLLPNADGTTCNLPFEKIHGTQNAWIVRVPFRDAAGEIIPHWISRFHLWPYLEQFAMDSSQVVVTQLMGKPDFIIGHYTDGNLVAHLLAEEFGKTHCACVHALEKTKYLLSDTHWADLESQYHFSLQFTADLLAYNSADFIVSSSFREIGGTATEAGMMESYDLFSMPGLYRVVSGFDARLARHNIVPPGASAEFFYPYTAQEKRITEVTEAIGRRMMASEPVEGDLGYLANPDLPMVFAMARMDKVKNLSGLVEMFGKHPALREHANLLLITSLNQVDQSTDAEEIEEVRKSQEFIEQYALEGHFRWSAARLNKLETGEIYRLVAERRGVFAQPAFMETFGLTVIEAMACGLPVVATCFGGPAEIIVDGDCGNVADPNDQELFGDLMLATLTDAERWQQYSERGERRVQDNFTWKRHATQLLRLANVHSYWNHTDVMNRPALDRYIHTLYHTVYKPRTQLMIEQS